MKRAMIFIFLVLAIASLGYGSQPTDPGEEPVLDETIHPIHVEQLEYPVLALQVRFQGVVIIRAKLDGDGRVISSKAVSGGKLLMPICLSNSLKWRFQSNAQREVVIVYDFRLGEGSCDFGSPCRGNFIFRPPNIAIVVAPPTRIEP